MTLPLRAGKKYSIQLVNTDLYLRCYDDGYVYAMPWEDCKEQKFVYYRDNGNEGFNGFAGGKEVGLGVDGEGHLRCTKKSDVWTEKSIMYFKAGEGGFKMGFDLGEGVEYIYPTKSESDDYWFSQQNLSNVKHRALFHFDLLD